MIHDLRDIDDDTLSARTLELVQKERRIGVEILHHLREVERRRLFLKRGFPSLFEYCVTALGYSTSAAHRRIAAMRLLRDLLPASAVEIEKKIQDGKLSLSVVAQAQTFFNQEKTDPAQKPNILLALEGKSSREAERELAARSTSPVLPRETTRPISSELTQITLTVDAGLLKDLEELKLLLSHKNHKMTWSDLFAELRTIALKKLAKRSSIRPNKKPAEPNNTPPHTFTPTNRYIPMHSRRELTPLRDIGCSYQDPKTQRFCGSRYQLELDHILPYSIGGDHSPANLRWLCRQHNAWRSQKNGPDGAEQVTDTCPMSIVF